MISEIVLPDESFVGTSVVALPGFSVGSRNTCD